ncbi:ATP-binding cassette domain-containing protein [Desulfosporosinus sp. BICA1-9]|uniref:ATP-binding cassette domain-containing protein n=1 Tax=Desulfosporosinus sp. BICA1-9 TaxID=1531958 RepID=UPI00054B9F5E|nr:MAG: hypothetical protein VR66_27065 [Peptococcaceae bacterium BRH_c23]KJS85536.1 MAG: hypothetical protein JL57_18700 [Desulfosporosinus sp. BICA1-9]
MGLTGYESRQTASLSGGEAQRVVLAGVLALNAPLLILDQPTAELDPQGRYELYKRLGQLNTTRIHVTTSHYLIPRWKSVRFNLMSDATVKEYFDLYSVKICRYRFPIRDEISKALFNQSEYYKYALRQYYRYCICNSIYRIRMSSCDST